MRDLTPSERMLLLELVCSFAWADREVRAEERRFIADLVRRLDLGGKERRQVDAWLAEPPPAVDPARVPREQRARFVHAIESVIAVDGEIAPSERERLLHFVRGLG